MKKENAGGGLAVCSALALLCEDGGKFMCAYFSHLFREGKVTREILQILFLFPFFFLFAKKTVSNP